MSQEQVTFASVYGADSVEFCPFAGYEDLFAVGNYLLVEGEEGSSKSNHRVGCVQVFKREESGLNAKQITRFDTDGILDMKWSSLLGSYSLLVADATGHVAILDMYENGELKLKQRELPECRYSEEPFLALSLDVCENKVVASYSDGGISLWQICEERLREVHRWSAHGFAAWTAAIEPTAGNVVISGGDDCFLFGWDCRDSESSKIFSIKGDVGFTSVQFGSQMMAVGSYDGEIRFFDQRKIVNYSGRPSPLTTLNVGGGVWRLKWHPRSSDLLACASMHNGFHVLHLNQSTQSFEIVNSRNEPHQSLAYGIDWSRISPPDTLVCCSFYDRLVSLWQTSD